MQYRLPGHVAVTLQWQDHQAGDPAVAANRLEQPLGLDRERARVRVVGAVHQQDRRADPVRVPERGDPVVNFGHFPVAAPLGLEPERSQRPVVGTASRDARDEQVGVREQVGGHEGAVAVTADGHPRRIGDTGFGERLDVRCRCRRDLLDVAVVLRLRITDHWHRGVG